ncbi:MAG: hypothetical protein L3J39_13110 [Verrucomicrobiales bacterium]|nr:hypothetical protein [Verrucomicrobiales bacterium]
MKVSITSFFIFLLTLVRVGAEVVLPDLTIEEDGEKQSLELRELSIKVRVSGLLVETILDLKFYNHSRRQQEGEFVLQLPEGATVSTYALDIKGYMRPGVAVEKGKARAAYESIKRRLVDPGLVEREEGNVYRTRIFPLEANRNKRVRIGFIQTLAKDGKYVLPLQHKGLIKKFTCLVEGAERVPRLTSEGLQQVVKKTAEQQWRWQANDVQMQGELSVTAALPEIDKPIVAMQRSPDGTRHFVVQGKAVRKQSDRLVEKWKKVRLIWDASFSRRLASHKEEFAALRRLWEWQQDCEVKVQILNTSLSEGRSFQIKKGNHAGDDLEKYLQQVTCDGAADFSQIEVDQWDGVTLLFTDGRLSSPIWGLDKDEPWGDFHLITSKGERVDPRLIPRGVSRHDLSKKGWWGRMISVLSDVQVVGGEAENMDVTWSGDFFTVSGKLPKDFVGELTLQVPGGKQVKLLKTAELIKNAGVWNFTRRVWAQRRLAELEKLDDQASITVFCEAERLVSDYTSLIVLESFADHVRYQIPPPEADLLEAYQRKLAARVPTAKRRAVRAWEAKNLWYATKFDWVDGEFEEEIRVVSIWVKASRIAFPDAKLNKKSLLRYEKWLSQAEKLRAANNALKSAQDFKAWTQGLDRSLKELQSFRENPVTADAGKAAYVSVRGFVKELGVYADGNPFFLSQAVEKAGGPNSYGSQQRVYLYRDAQRRGYNMASSRYVDVELLWGDMVVVETIPYSEYGCFAAGLSDPFADAGSASGGGDSFSDDDEGSSGDPVFEQAGEQLVRRDSSQPSSQPADTLGDETLDDVGEEELLGVFPSTQEGVMLVGLNQEILKSLRESEEPRKAYFEWLRGGNNIDSISMAMVVELARWLFEEKQTDLALRVLSNLCELQSNSFEGTRTYAYWLAELGDSARAIEVLERLAEVTSDEKSRALLYFDLGQLSGKVIFFEKSVQSEIEAEGKPSLATISLMDYFSRDGKAVGDLSLFKANAMPSDVRIVVTSIGGDVDMEVKKPSQYRSFADNGGRLRRGDRVDEYMMRRALPGVYKVSLRRWESERAPITVRVDFYIRWASGKEQKRSRTLLMEGRELDLGELVFEWGE